MKCRLTDMIFPLYFYALNFAHRRENEYLKLNMFGTLTYYCAACKLSQRMLHITISKLVSTSLI